MKHPSVDYRKLGLVVISLAISLGCHRDMYDQPRFEPLEGSTFFSDGLASRPLVPGTIARGQLELDDKFFQGKVDGKPVDELPLELNASLLVRGQERFNIYCTPCHGRVGEGDGMVVRRGFRRPPSYHIDRLRGMPVGHFFDVITHGFGAMPSFAGQVEPADRWAIVAYLRALQLSQYAPADELDETDRTKLTQKVSP